jgi:hypothetical protein
MARPFKPLFAPLTAQWNTLLHVVDGKYKLSSLRVLGSFASSRGVEPHQVDDALLTDLEIAAKAMGLPRPTQMIRDISLNWNNYARKSPGWPPP